MSVKKIPQIIFLILKLNFVKISISFSPFQSFILQTCMTIIVQKYFEMSRIKFLSLERRVAKGGGDEKGPSNMKQDMTLDRFHNSDSAITVFKI